MGNWDTATPAGTDLISAGDDVIREMKDALEEALSTEAVFPGGSPGSAPIFKWTGKRGNTAGRPASPDTGEIYFNTQLFQMEYYDGATWTAYDLVPLLGITTAKINDLAVTTGKINDLAVTTGKINDLAVTTGKINDLGVTTGKIAALAVTDAKINDMAASKLTGAVPVANGGTGLTTKFLTTGTYTGNGGSDRAIPHGLGTTPDLVIIADNSTASNIPELFITGMGSSSHDFNGVRQTNAIKSVDGTNINIGNNNAVNQNTVTYSWVAFKAQ
jgi:hypothetical protein